ncbi:MAG: CDP-diacylglycerol--glycerol-3-phosphate 3-phosphatidyltransferase [Clostridia bacterium]|nr:CDP-diacylglycerol--glycerol-3-phosphate 3-phosphatidyltransferase [Clostridia bacterium]
MKLNLPNKITLIRIFMIPIFVAVFFIQPLGLWRFLIAAIVFLLAAATDALDGYIARSRGLVTNLGKFLDPIADKVLVSTAMILLLAAKDEFFGVFGIYCDVLYIATTVCVCVIMARELIISAFRQIAATAGVVMAADKLGKFKTIFQDVSIVVFLAGGAFGDTEFGKILLIVAFCLFAIATVLTVVSGVAYVVNNRAVLKDAN